MEHFWTVKYEISEYLGSSQSKSTEPHRVILVLSICIKFIVWRIYIGWEVFVNVLQLWVDMQYQWLYQKTKSTMLQFNFLHFIQSHFTIQRVINFFKIFWCVLKIYSCIQVPFKFNLISNYTTRSIHTYLGYGK